MFKGRITPPKRATLDKSFFCALVSLFSFIAWIVSLFVWHPKWSDIFVLFSILSLSRAYELLFDGVTNVGK